MVHIKTKRERVEFASDNVTGACPEVLEAIIIIELVGMAYAVYNMNQ